MTGISTEIAAEPNASAAVDARRGEHEMLVAAPAEVAAVYRNVLKEIRGS